jgi:uncharacterized protein YbjT (DUF2867 family)
MQGDFAQDVDPHQWAPKLRGIDIVINAVGIIRESPGQKFARIHSEAPRALFSACVMAGVHRVIQVSALGAETGTTPYFASKREADEFLAMQPLEWTIVRPSLVYGAHGASARLFNLLASLPFIPVPGCGEQRVQPIHIDDLIDALCTIVSDHHGVRAHVPLTGPRPRALREMLIALRRGMRLGPARFIHIPMTVMRIAAAFGTVSGQNLLDTDTLTMLEHGNTADACTTRQLLRREPRDVEQFLNDGDRTGVALSAKLGWLLPLLRISVAAVWLWTGVVSFGLYPREASYELLAQAHVPAQWAPAALNVAAGLDILLGLATLFLPRRRMLWVLQGVTMLTYTLIISVALPQFWLHPYGPILKNLPLLAAIYLLYSLEDPRWNT